MSTTRHRRRSWQQIGLETTAGVLIGSDAVLTVHAHNGLLHLAAAALGVIAGMLIAGAFSFATSIGWHRARHRYLVHAVADAPLRRPLHPISAEALANPNDEVALHYVTAADRWCHDDDRRGRMELDAVTGSRPYLNAATPSDAATAGAAQ